MELKSTVAFKEIDIDRMLQHTSLDDFLRGLYTTATTPKGKKEDKGMMSEILAGNIPEIE